MQLRLTLLAMVLVALGSLHAQSLAITEVMYNPPESGTDSLEFIEIYNYGSTDVSVDGYRISVTGSNVADTLKGTIPAGGFYVSAVNARAFQAIYGKAASSQWLGSGLSNGGNREIVLTDGAGNVIVAFTYLNTTPWPAISNANGPSIELCSPTADPKLGANWNASTTAVGVAVNNQELKASPFAFTPGTCGGGTAPSYTMQRIDALRDNNAEGVPVLLDSLVRVSGIVVGNDLRGNGLQFTLIDNTNEAGVAIFSGSASFGYVVNEGDILRISGRVSQFNGLTQLIPDSLTVLGTQALPAPVTVTSLDESTESRLVRLVGVRFVDVAGQFGTDTTRSYNLDAVTAGGDSIDIRIERNNRIDRDLTVQLMSSDFTIVGIGTQFDASAPYNDGYQITPRRDADFSGSTAVVEVPVAEVFSARRNGSNLDLELRQAVREVIVTDVSGRRVAVAQPAHASHLSFELGDVQTGVVYVTAVLPNGGRATQALVW